MNTRVLIVDDEKAIRKSVAAFLEDFDFQVSMAESAEEALTLLTHTTFDVGIIDLRLPGISGDAMILQAHAIAPDMQFLIYTGSVNFILSPALRKIGMHSEQILQKPIFDMMELVKSIRALLSKEKQK